MCANHSKVGGGGEERKTRLRRGEKRGRRRGGDSFGMWAMGGRVGGRRLGVTMAISQDEVHSLEPDVRDNCPASRSLEHVCFLQVNLGEQGEK